MKLHTITILRLEGGVVFVSSLLAYNWLAYSWWWFALLLLVPDVFMVGYLKSKNAGAVTYNFGHSYISPATLTLIAYLANWHIGYAFAAIWVAHIGMDRLMGYGLKSQKGFEHTHLGKIGKS
jgi:hypothetical protein